MAVRFGVSSTVKNRLPRYSNFWDGTAVYNPFVSTGSYDALVTYTVPSGGVSNITFANLPTGGQYTHLQIRVSSQTNRATYGSDAIRMQLNGDTGSNYSTHNIAGDGSAASAGANTSCTYMDLGGTLSGVINGQGGTVADILDFASVSKYKTVRSLSGGDHNGTIAGYGGTIFLASGSWRSFSAVSSLTIFPVYGSAFNQYTTVTVYGVRG